MLWIQEKMVDESLIKTKFACNLNACKGACCWEGDYGAPLEDAELHTLEAIYDSLSPYLLPEAKSEIKKKGLFTYYKEMKSYGTPLLNNGACVYMTKDILGVAKCGIEQAYKNGDISFYKPISCHLYPVRVTEDRNLGIERLNYDEWDICSAACSQGNKENIRVFEFVKSALIRKYGKEFYEELEAASVYMEKH